MRSDSRTWRTSPQAEPSTCVPFQISPTSTTTTAEFSAAIDRMRQRIGTARSIADQTRAQPPERAGRPVCVLAVSRRSQAAHSTLRMRSISAAAAGSRPALA